MSCVDTAEVRQAKVMHIAQMLACSSSPSVSNEQRLFAYHELSKFEAEDHEFPGFLAFLFAGKASSATGEFDLPVRLGAGFLLKNIVLRRLSTLSDQIKEDCKAAALSAISNPLEKIRNTSSTMIATFVQKMGLASWAGLVDRLISGLESSNVCEVDGAFEALHKICEDVPEQVVKLDNGAAFERLFVMITRYLLCNHESFQVKAIQCINQFLILFPPVMMKNSDHLVKAMLVNARDQSIHVRKLAGQFLVISTEIRFQIFSKYLRELVDTMLFLCSDESEDPCLDAFEFWYIYCKNEDADVNLVWEKVSVILPLLLKQMKYTDEELSMILLESQDDSVPDRPEDIRPFTGSRQKSVDIDGDDYSEDQDEDVLDSGLDDYDTSGMWSVRKFAARSFEGLSFRFGDAILPLVLPLIEKCLNSPDDVVKESGVLAVGAISEGCIKGLEAHLPAVIQLMCSFLISDSSSIVRSISAWTLGRYLRWITHEGSRLFPDVLRCFLTAAIDPNKQVQEASCSAITGLVEECHEILLPFLNDITQTFIAATTRYQEKNRVILYDSIASFAENFGQALIESDYTKILVPDLMRRWFALPITEKSQFSIMECLNFVCRGLGPAFFPMVSSCVDRCLQVIEIAPTVEDSSDFYVAGLDFLSGIFDSLKSMKELSPLVYEFRSRLASAISSSLSFEDPNTRQSAIALFADVFKQVFSSSFYENFRITVLCLDPAHVYLCNNASWAIGEIAIRMREAVEPWIGEIISRIVTIWNKKKSNGTLCQNLAITLGRLAFVAPATASEHLPVVLSPWCVYLSRYRNDPDKLFALRGLMQTCSKNPSASLHNFGLLMMAICTFSRPPQDFAAEVTQFISGLGSIAGEAWPAVLRHVPKEVKAEMISKAYVSPF